MGAFGRVAPDASADYVAVMRFEPNAATPFVKELPAHLIDVPSVSQGSAVGAGSSFSTVVYARAAAMRALTPTWPL
jgi:hypothetical protein